MRCEFGRRSDALEDEMNSSSNTVCEWVGLFEAIHVAHNCPLSSGSTRSQDSQAQ